MANVIMIDYMNPFSSRIVGNEVQYADSSTVANTASREVVICPLVEDLTLQLETKFMTPSSLMGGSSFEKIAELLSLGQTAFGQRSRSANILDILDVPIWEKTDPPKFDIKLQFFLDTDAYLDVIRPAIGLVSLSILSPDYINGKGDTFLLPGINLSNLSGTLESLNNATQEGKNTAYKAISSAMLDISNPQNKGRFSKIISVEIPGMLYLPLAIIEKADIIFSKEIVENGFPLWSEVTLSITGLRAANTDMFVPGANAMSTALTAASSSYEANLNSNSILNSKSGAL